MSLAEKHQLLLAHNMTMTEGHPNSMFVYKGDVVKEGEVWHLQKWTIQK